MNPKVYWGDTHTNIRSGHLPHIDGILEEAARIVDFLAPAYYPFAPEVAGSGFRVESWGQRDRFLPE